MNPLGVIALVLLIIGVVLASGAAAGWLPAVAGHAGTAIGLFGAGLALFASAR